LSLVMICPRRSPVARGKGHCGLRQPNRRSKIMEKAFISPAELKTLMASEPVVVIDSRDPASYAAGHIPGAVNLHDIFTYLATSTPEGMKELTGKFADA